MRFIGSLVAQKQTATGCLCRARLPWDNCPYIEYPKIRDGMTSKYRSIFPFSYPNRFNAAESSCANRKIYRPPISDKCKPRWEAPDLENFFRST